MELNILLFSVHRHRAIGKSDYHDPELCINIHVCPITFNWYTFNKNLFYHEGCQFRHNYKYKFDEIDDRWEKHLEDENKVQTDTH